MSFDGLDSIPGQLDVIRDRLDHGDVMQQQFALKMDTVSARLDAGDLRMRFIEVALAENTAMTRNVSETMTGAAKQLTDAAETLKDIREYQVAGRVIKKSVAWAGGIGAGIAGMAAAWATFWGQK